MEAPTGFEPVKKGFADLCVTIPPQRHWNLRDYLIVTATQLFIKVIIVCKIMKECTACKSVKLWHATEILKIN